MLGKVGEFDGGRGSKGKSGGKPGGISEGLLRKKLLLLLLSSLIFLPRLKRSNLVWILLSFILPNFSLFLHPIICFLLFVSINLPAQDFEHQIS